MSYYLETVIYYLPSERHLCPANLFHCFKVEPFVLCGVALEDNRRRGSPMSVLYLPCIPAFVFPKCSPEWAPLSSQNSTRNSSIGNSFSICVGQLNPHIVRLTAVKVVEVCVVEYFR
jgi:hypothetical protein